MEKQYARKSTKASMELRVKEVINMLLKGSSREDIVQYSSDNWTISERQADKYLKRAKERIASSISRQIDYDYAKAVRRFEELYSASVEKKDYRTAMAINKELTTLQGLYKYQIEHTGAVQFICNIPD